MLSLFKGHFLWSIQNLNVAKLLSLYEFMSLPNIWITWYLSYMFSLEYVFHIYFGVQHSFYSISVCVLCLTFMASCDCFLVCIHGGVLYTYLDPIFPLGFLYSVM